MAKPKAPLLAFEVSGTVGKTTVFGSTRGKQTARRHVIPANPKTAEQNKTRGTFNTGSKIWKNAGPLLKAPWDKFASGKILSGYNKFVGNFTRQNRGQVNLQSWKCSIETFGAPPSPFLFMQNVFPGQLIWVAPTPTPPTGWTALKVTLVMVEDQDPETAIIYETIEDEENAGVFGHIVGLKNGVLFVCGSFLKWSKPDGSLAYSEAVVITHMTT